MKFLSLIIYALAAGLVVLAAHYGLARSLGAHPFWDRQVALIGAPIGVALAWSVRAMKWRWSTRLFLFLLAFVLAGTAAHQGRLAFAASFAENQLAGQFWFFGWIASAACLTGLICTLLTPRRRR